jgi:CheY-like chemotaxis protein
MLAPQLNPYPSNDRSPGVSKRVLDVGQCNPDHSSLSHFLTSNFDVQVDRSHEMDDTLQKLQSNHYDMVMINRKLDRDYSDGMEILRKIKADDATKEIPIVLISNYDDAQEAAIKAGAAPGFGKAQLGDAATLEKVTAILGG